MGFLDYHKNHAPCIPGVCVCVCGCINVIGCTEGAGQLCTDCHIKWSRGSDDNIEHDYKLSAVKGEDNG